MKPSILACVVLSFASGCALFGPPAPRLGPNLSLDGDSVAIAFPQSGYTARMPSPSTAYLVRVRESAANGFVDFFSKNTVGHGVEPAGTNATPEMFFYFQKVEPRSVEEWVNLSIAQSRTLLRVRDTDDGRGGHELLTTIYTHGRRDFRYVRLLKMANGYFECGGTTGGEQMAREIEAFCASLTPTSEANHTSQASASEPR